MIVDFWTFVQCVGFAVASVVVGLAIGIPMGLLVVRIIWRFVD
ncbi:MAG TPA: hypothetical protein VM238_18510 [Phycisphaerae bacterium]|nr:hypothetical protein [Phycisphaerae bacterium]